ncbi:MAG: hypothetical protein ACREQ5_03265 [Candidatus Dormibacteria bacterium]
MMIPENISALFHGGHPAEEMQRERRPKTHNSRKGMTVRIPFLGRMHLAWERNGTCWLPGGIRFGTNLDALHFRRGKLHDQYALGSGLVTNVGVLALANDFNWASPSGAKVSTLTLANFHATGTGTTAAAASDIALQSSAGPSPVTGTQTLVSAANSQVYKTVATVAYTGTLAITEWGLHSSATLSATTGSPFTATSATSGTATGTPFTTSSSTVQGQQMNVVKAGTTTVWGLILSNTTSVLTIPAWYTVASGAAGSTPGSTETYSLLPTMWDHKVFSAINVINGDSIQFSYSLTISSGG